MSDSVALKKALNPFLLGISGRQSELNELALSYGFECLDVDFPTVVRRAQERDLATAAMFLYLPLGQFELPISLHGDDADFQAALQTLKSVLEIAQQVKATRCVHVLEPTSDAAPYHENFELHRERIGRVAEVLGEYGVRLGLGVCGATGQRGDGQFQFIQQADDLIAFLNTLNSQNVGLALDSWNWKLAGGTLEQVRELGAERIVTVTLADIAPDADLDAITAADRMLPMPEGLVDNTGCVALLMELGYDGPVTLAPSPENVQSTRNNAAEMASRLLDCLLDPKSAEIGDAAETEDGASQDSQPAEDSKAAPADAAETQDISVAGASKSD